METCCKIRVRNAPHIVSVWLNAQRWSFVPIKHNPNVMLGFSFGPARRRGGFRAENLNVWILGPRKKKSPLHCIAVLINSGSPQQGHGLAFSLLWQLFLRVRECTCVCAFCLVCKLKEWKLACVFIDYIEHLAQSQKASSFKFSNTVTASTPQRWCEPHYTTNFSRWGN